MRRCTRKRPGQSKTRTIGGAPFAPRRERCLPNPRGRRRTLYNLEGGAWSDEILNPIGLDSRRLPDIHNSTDIIGEITKEAAEQLGLAAGTPVVIGGGGGASAGGGAGAGTEGPAYNYIGSPSSSFFLPPRPLFLSRHARSTL